MMEVLNWGSEVSQIEESAAELNEYISRLRLAPLEVRRFLGAVVSRIYRVRETRAVEFRSYSMAIRASDLRRALRLDEAAIAGLANELDAYGLGDIDEIDTDLGMQPAIRIRYLSSGWTLWRDIAEFCEKAHEPLAAFTEDLDFRRLD